jgi:exonuclease
MDSFVALDFETANRERSSVCSIGLVFVEDRHIVDHYYRLIRPLPDFYSYYNTTVHGLTASDTATASTFPEVWREIHPRLGDLPIVAHNSSFDEGCLRAVLAAYGLPLHTNPFYCTCRQSRRLFPELPNHRLETVSQRVGYHLADHHHALADAEACAYIALEVFRDLP